MLDTNFIAIAVATVVSLAVATIWYSPLLFGGVWMRSAGLKEGDEEGGVTLAVRLGAAFLAQCVAFLAMTSFLDLRSASRVESPLLALTEIALLTALLFVSLVIWEKKPFSYFLVHGGYLLVALVGGGAIIMYWPW